MRAFPVCAAAALWLAAPASPATVTQLRVSTFACDSGPYAVVLPRHYPTLHVIGRHRTTDLVSGSAGQVTSTTRRIEYIGMTADVLLSSAEPNAYKLLALDAISRRWNIGPLSVGQNPWRSVKDPALDGVIQDGTIEILGTRDSVRLVVRGARIDTVSYRCPLAGPQ